MLTKDMTPEQRRERCQSCQLPRAAHPDDGASPSARRIGRVCTGFQGANAPTAEPPVPDPDPAA